MRSNILVYFSIFMFKFLIIQTISTFVLGKYLKKTYIEITNRIV